MSMLVSSYNNGKRVTPPPSERHSGFQIQAAAELLPIDIFDIWQTFLSQISRARHSIVYKGKKQTGNKVRTCP